MTTGQVDVKHIAKLPSVKSWRSTALAKRLVFKLFNQLRHGELVIQDGDTTHRFGGGDVSIAPSATVVIHEQRAYSRILTGGTMGAAEAYIDGDWSTEQLTDVTRVFSANIPILEAMKHKQNWFIKAGVKLAHAARKNSVSGSRENIAGLWISLANKANFMASYLSRELCTFNEFKLFYPTQANEVFLEVSKETYQEMLKLNIISNLWSRVDHNNFILRFVTSFETEKSEIDELLSRINTFCSKC